MQRAALLTTLAILLPLAAHADPAAAPPLRPPLMPKVSSVDDIIGDWKVTSTIRFTSCNPAPAMPGPRVEEGWAIDHQAGTITIRTDAAQEYTGAAGTTKYNTYRHQLNGKPRPSEEVLQINQFLKDRIFGTILRAQTTPRKGVREVCVTQIDIHGKRANP